MRLAALLLAFLFGAACAQTPQRIAPESLQWMSPPTMPGVQGAWVLGGEKQPGAYLFRVKLAPGARIPPHTHPDERATTVLRGAIHVGFGDRLDESRMVRVAAGEVYVAPAGVVHYILAKDGEAEYQESGIGPTATVPR